MISFVLVFVLVECLSLVLINPMDKIKKYYCKVCLPITCVWFMILCMASASNDVWHLVFCAMSVKKRKVRHCHWVLQFMYNQIEQIRDVIPGSPLTYFNNGGPSDFLGSAILAKSSFWVYKRRWDFLGVAKERQRDVLGLRKKD